METNVGTHRGNDGLILTVPEAARLLRIGRNGLYEAIRGGEVPVLRIGRRVLVPRPALDKLLQRVAEVHR